jgi:hypothetical protein
MVVWISKNVFGGVVEGEKWLLVVCNKEEARAGAFSTKCGPRW